MVDSMQDKRTKHVIETLQKQYKTEKYGRLHRSLFKHGIRTELYIGDGIEMYYPYFYKPVITLQVLDDENLVIIYKHEPKLKGDCRIIKKIRKIAKSLNYKVMQINELPDEKPERFCTG
jgi:hypothetical protein